MDYKPCMRVLNMFIDIINKQKLSYFKYNFDIEIDNNIKNDLLYCLQYIDKYLDTKTKVYTYNEQYNVIFINFTYMILQCKSDKVILSFNKKLKDNLEQILRYIFLINKID